MLLVLVAVLLLLLPMTGEAFYMSLASRIMIFGLAALSLDLIVGYGGLLSFGHAAFFGMGAYITGILTFHGVENGFIVWPAAIAASAFAALLIGALSLRTTGVYFIMITLAFAQMLFYLAVSLPRYGGDDGMPLNARNHFGGLIDIDNPATFYYLTFGLVALVLFVCHRLVNARFGMAMRGTMDNEQRMRSIGHPTYRYQLTAFVIGGAIAGLAGALAVNLNEYVSPSFLDWRISGILFMMVMMGGLASLFGPLLGAAIYLGLEEILSSYTQHWMVIFGPVLLLSALFWKRGIDGLIDDINRRIIKRARTTP